MKELLAWWPEALAAVVVLVTRILTMPRTFWESDELLFASAVKSFDPWSSHPHPPGYPLYVGLGKAFNLLFGDPFAALVTLSVVSCVIGFLALAAAFRRALADRALGICGALFFYFTAAMLVHGTLPLSDAPSLMFVALALYASTFFPSEATQRTAIGLGLACSAAIGTRPQLAIILVPLLVLLLIWTRDVRKIVAGAIAFAVLSLLWFLPLMDAAGGWDKLVQWETRQAAYVAAHDAAASRGAKTAGMIVARFLAHPFGPKWIAIPVFAVSLLGFVYIARIPRRRLVPIAGFTIAYFVFAVAVMDPADAARYSLPHIIGVAVLFAAGLGTIRHSSEIRSAPLVLTAVAAIAALAYTEPILRIRRTEPSPPVAAAEFIRRSVPRNATVLYDLSMRPFAEYLLPDHKLVPIEVGVRALHGPNEHTPAVIYADGGSPYPDARVFSWPESDAYGKLTRNHFRVVTVDPFRVPEHYVPVRGVYALERTPQGEEWRWLASDATIRLPHAAVGASVVLKLSPDAPYESDDVRILANGTEVARATVTKRPTVVSVPLPGTAPCDLRFVSQKSFSPATVLHNQDPRILAVQLLHIETR